VGTPAGVAGTLWRLAEVVDVPVDQPRSVGVVFLAVLRTTLRDPLLGSSGFRKNPKRSGVPPCTFLRKLRWWLFARPPDVLEMTRVEFCGCAAALAMARGECNDESFGSMEAARAVRAPVHVARVAGPGRVHVRDVGPERAGGRLRRRCRPVAPEARERRQHVLALPAAVRELEPGPTQWPSCGRG
jgi:hypothetical protein